MRIAPLFHRRLAAALLLVAPLGGLAASPALAAPADYATVVADPGRSAENRALDEGRLPAAVLDFAGLKRGWTVADWGAGGGYYSELIARVVGPKGRVLALGNPRFYKAEPWDKLKAAHPNVGVLVAPNLSLAPRSVDAIFSHLEFHDLFVPPKPGEAGIDPAAVLANWFAAVKPGGVVVIADHWAPEGDPAQIAGTLHRIDPAVVTRAMTAAGFVADGESNVLRRSEDDRSLRVFDPTVRGKTDRFLLKFRHP